VPVIYRAAWVLPISRPLIQDGWVAVDRGRIAAVGSADAAPPSDDIVDIGSAAILPGLVNAHTHLELSWMRGQVAPAASMPAWAARLMALRRTVGHEPREPIAEAIGGAHASGTAVIGDVTNTLAAYELLADSQLAAAIFRELLGFNAADPGAVVASASAALEDLTPIAWLRPSLVPHAPYSVSPDLFRAIAAASAGRPLSVHVAESAEEVRFLRDGTGAWRELLGDLGVWSDRWVPPGESPVEYLDRLGLVSNLLLAVHCVHASEGSLHRLAEAGATVVTCPRSNRWTGAGVPPVERFYASGVRVAIGTDSLASVDDLNLFAELAEVRRLAPGVPAARLLDSATRAGAEALGFASEFGTLDAGKCADLIAVRVPAGVSDVEEYLLSGVTPDQIRWLST
jgi:cytosine/adenosine deaminase-related metal-dependent hydrolase